MANLEHLGSRQLRHALDVGQRSQFVERLLLSVGWGLISPNCGRWLAEGIELDGFNHPAVARMSKLRTQGSYAGNVRRDMMRTFCHNMTVPKPCRVSAPVKNTDLSIEWIDIKIVNPVAVLECIYQDYRDQFSRFVGGGLEGFWKSVRDDDPRWATLGAIRSRPDWQKKAIPYILHGDKAVFTKTSESIDGFNFLCLLASSFSGVIIHAFKVLAPSQ